MRIIDLKQKEVIDASTCKSLGCPVDVEFDPRNGQIKELIIPGPGKFYGMFGRDSEYCIPWNSICQIGEDIILINLKDENVLKKF